jgi:Amino acid permease
MSPVAFSADRQVVSSHPPRDSLELASLASTSSAERSSVESSRSGISSSRKLSLEADDPLAEQDGLGSYRTRGNRSYSVSSAFDFGSNLFPLSQTTAGGYAPLGAPSVTSLERYTGLRDGSLEKHKTLTYLNGLSLIVGLIIGSGIFSSPSQVNFNAGSPGAALIVWVIAGILAWTGAASYAELGGAIPLNGGPQVYLSKIFGEMIGFLFTWCAVFVLKPGSAAIIAIIFGEYVVRAFIGTEVETISPWINKGVGFAGVLFVTIINCASTKLATLVGDISMLFKFGALLAIAIIGLVVAITGTPSKGQPNQDWKNIGWFDGTSTNISDWAVALYAGLWAYDGWDNVSPLSIIAVALCYI